MLLKLKNITAPSYGLVCVYAVAALLLWAVTYAGALHPYGGSLEELALALSARPGDGAIGWNVLSFFLTLFNAFLLSQLINRFGFVGERTFLPVFAFVLLVTVWEPTHVLWRSHAALALFALALFRFLDMYRNPAATECAFTGMLLLAVATLTVNDLLLIVPVCWVGFAALQSLSLRTFLASLFGLLAPWVLYAAGLYLVQGGLQWTELADIRFSPGFSMEDLMVPTRIYIALLFAVFFVTLVGTYTAFGRKANHTRRSINFVLVLLAGLLVVFLLQAEFDGTLFPFTAFCFAVFIANVYSAGRNDFYHGLFLFFVLINLLFVVFNFLW